MSQPKQAVTSQSAIRLLWILLLSIFTVELAIMAVFLALPPLPIPEWGKAVLDASALSVALAPVLYWDVFRPLARHIKTLKEAEAALRTLQGQLELRIRERTAKLEQRNREISLLAEMTEVLLACARAEEACSVITRTGQQLFPGAKGALFLYNASHNNLEARTTWGEFTLNPNECVFAPEECWALRRGRAHQYEGPRTGLSCRHVTPPLLGTYLCVPMIAQGEVLGILHLRQNPLAAESAAGTPPLDERAAVVLAEHVALALINLKLRDTLRDQAIRDPLTGLLNRRHMEETLEREVLRAERSQHPLGVVLLDLDHFKRFNDSFGHDAGDLVLRQLGALLRMQVRAGDMACRYGGEEFVLILPETPLDIILQRAEALRLGIKQLDVRQGDRPLGIITGSAGIAMFPEHGATGEALLRVADRALYRAKAEGRDRVVAADAPVASA